VADRHLFEVAAWERPPDDVHWRVEFDEVEAALEEAMRSYHVVELACDPHEWRAQLQVWQARRWPVVEWPTNSLERMIPAWKEFYAAVMERRLSHDGSPGLARHVENAVLKIDQRGARPTKEYGTSGRKIDRLIAAIIAHDRAAFHARQPPRRERIYGSFR
jgi:phage terminase large subunit-like protein